MTPITAILFFICLSFLIVILGLVALILLLRKNVTLTTWQQRQDADVIEAEYTLQSPHDEADVMEIEAYPASDVLPIYPPHVKLPEDEGP